MQVTQAPALSNLLGSDNFNMGRVLAADAAAHTSAPLLASISCLHVIGSVEGVVMTAILVMAPSRRRSETEHVVDCSIYVRASAIIGVFLAASALVFVQS